MGCRYLRELYFNPQVNILFVFAFVWKGYIQVVMTAWHDNRMVVTFTAMRVKIINKSNFQCQPAEEQIMPRVIACLLRHLPLLQVQHEVIPQGDINYHTYYLRPITYSHVNQCEDMLELSRVKLSNH